MIKLTIPPFQVRYTDSWNTAFFKTKRDAEKFAKTKEFSNIIG